MRWIVLCVIIVAAIGEMKHREHEKKVLFQECVLSVMREIYFNESLSLGLSSFLGITETAFDLCTGKRKQENYDYFDVDLLAEMQLAYCRQPHYFAYLCALQCAQDLALDDPDRVSIGQHCSRARSLKSEL